MICEALVLLFVELHGPTGQPLYVNAVEVSSLRQPIEALKNYAKGVNCVLLMASGRTLAVAETCAAVARKLGEAK